MEIFWQILILLIAFLGIAGAILPILPGPLISLIAVLIDYFLYPEKWALSTLLIYLLLGIVVSVFDYLSGVWGAKRFGGSKLGVRFSIAGMLIGLLFPPFGLIIGPILGAIIGEMINQNNLQKAFKAAIGSFIGFLMGTFAKLIFCVWIFVKLMLELF